MYKPREKSTGWAAFDQQQRHKHGTHTRVTSDPFPSLSSTLTLFQNPDKEVSGNKQLSMKPFSSVVGSVDFKAPAQDNSKSSRQSEIGNSSGILRETSADIKFEVAFKWLQQQYTWADANLIQDVMVAADNDPNMASSFLKAMISDNILKDGRCQDSANNVEILPGEVSSSMEASADNDSPDGNSDFPVLGEIFSDNLVKINSRLGQLTCVPVEPEWEEDDDLYLTCRKDALKMMRAATRHSKAATNSYQRGDHYSAQQFSLKAQEEWESANRLNAKAAREILSIRNESNGIWRLDLHGLHASEAVQALQEHLHKIETELYLNGSTSLGLPNGSRTKAYVLHASSLDGDNKMEKIGEQALCMPNLKWLEVITGIGNHSRGGAALPTTVKTFLVDNGYIIDEARPGVIMVRPKFRSP